MLQATIREWHAKTADDIHGVARGYKITNGVRTNELSIVFMVLHKRPLAELRPEEILPTSLVIDNETISTDVVQMDAFTATTHIPGHINPAFICQDPSAAPHRAYTRPLIGGISMSHNERGATAGTLGGLFRDKEDGSVVGLTNCHVVCPRVWSGATWSSHKNPEWVEEFIPWDIESKKTIQPGIFDNGSVYPNGGNIGKIKRYYPLTRYYEQGGLDTDWELYLPESGEINYIDAAVVGVDSGSLRGANSGGQLTAPQPSKGIYKTTNTTPIQVWPMPAQISNVGNSTCDGSYGNPTCYLYNPIEPAGFYNGQTVVISGHTGNTAANGTWKITSVYGPNIGGIVPEGQEFDDQRFSFSFFLDGSVGNGNCPIPIRFPGDVQPSTGTITRLPWGGNPAGYAYPVATTEEIDNLVPEFNLIVKSSRTSGYNGNTSKGFEDFCDVNAYYDNVVLAVGYGDGGLAFADQILIAKGAGGMNGYETGDEVGSQFSPMQPGDSGSIILADLNGVLKIVGLGFASGPIYGVISRIDHVMRLLNLEALGSTTSINPPSNWSFINLKTPYSEPGTNTVIATRTFNGIKYWECGKLANGNTKYVTYTPVVKTVSSPPLNVVAMRGSASLSVTWTTPVNNGNSEITDYPLDYSSNNGASWTRFSRPASSQTSCLVTGLTNGTAYICRVIAGNEVGYSAASVSSLPVIPLAPPSAPSNVVVSRGNASLSVTWTVPADNGSSAITDYLVQYSSNNGGSFTTFADPVSTATSCVVTGLTNGTTYVIRVIARNAIGNGLPSANSAPVIFASVPSIPTKVVSLLGFNKLVVNWLAPVSNGGSAITDYLVQYSSNNGSTWTTFTDLVSSATSCVVTGLTNGTAYVIRVSARNAIGDSVASVPSLPVVPAITVPDRATALTVTRGNNSSLNVSWVAPLDNGGSPITKYLVKYQWVGSSSWTVLRTTGLVTSLIITNLTPGTPYMVKVIAQNAKGISLPTANPLPVIPITVPGSPMGVVTTIGSSNSSINVRWTAPARDGGSAITDYLVDYSSDNGSSWARFTDLVSSATSCVITGLAQGAPYIIRVYAKNAAGNSDPSIPSARLAPATLPGAPATIVAINRPVYIPKTTWQQGYWRYPIVVTWTAPLSNGGSAITGYDIYVYPYLPTNPAHWSWTSYKQPRPIPLSTTFTTVEVSKNANYGFRIYATNSAGKSLAYAFTSIRTDHTIPDSPTGVVVTKNNSGLVVAWNRPSMDSVRGGPGTQYFVEYSSDSGLSWTLFDEMSDGWDLGNSDRYYGLPITITGLTNGTYVVRAYVVNYKGSSLPSANSAPVTF